MTAVLHYFRWPIGLTVLGLALAFVIGFYSTDSLGGGLSFLMIGTVLAILEISLSFDNAIVNANKLKSMTPVWQRRFLTWGIIIAVFGMRIVFPLAVVAIAAKIGPISAIVLAAAEPQEYSRIMNEAHLSIAAFGGTFLMMVALNYFIDHEKDVHWLQVVESRLSDWSSLRGVEIAIVLAAAMAFTWALPRQEENEFLFAAMAGLLTSSWSSSWARSSTQPRQHGMPRRRGALAPSSISRSWTRASPSTG